MKPVKSFVVVSMLCSVCLHAQTSNPFQSISKKAKTVSLTNGKYSESYDDAVMQRIGSVVIDTRTKKVVQILDADSISNSASDNTSASRWISTDPLASKIPNISPYAYCTNNPILQFDPTGEFPYTIHVRSFAPFETFGLRFAGDGSKRGYTTALGKGEGGIVTSRMQHAFIVDPTARSIDAGHAWSDESSHPLLGTATATTHANVTNFATSQDDNGNNVASFTTNMAAANPLVKGSADIDIHTNFTITENDKAGMLNINAVQTGDAFPAAETFIGDSKGNQLFIGVSPAIGGPYTSLPGDGNIKMMSANFTVTIDKDGVFTGVKQEDKTYNIKDWNDIMKQKPTTK
jgi:hypothetical protein